MWPYNWPFDWPFWTDFLTEGVVFYEELGIPKKASAKKCARSVHPKNATEVTRQSPDFHMCCDRQEQQSQTLIVRLLKTHLFSLINKLGGPPLAQTCNLL